MCKISAPNLVECKSFEVFLAKLKVWEAHTLIVKAQLGALMVASLPKCSRWYTIQDKLFKRVDWI